jgi:hypothetical protein
MNVESQHVIDNAKLEALYKNTLAFAALASITHVNSVAVQPWSPESGKDNLRLLTQ